MTAGTDHPHLFGGEVSDRLAAFAVSRVKQKAAATGTRLSFTPAETKCLEMGAYAAIIEVQDYLTAHGVLREEPS